MENRIRQYIDRAFRDVPQSAKNNDLKESLRNDLLEKYDGLVAIGKTEEEAYSGVISGIGDLNELTQGLIKEAEEHYIETKHDKKRGAILVSSAVALYILTPIAPIICDHFGLELLGPCLFFAIAALATGIIIYYNMTKPSWKKVEFNKDDVEEWAPPKIRRLYASVSGSVWVLTVVVYLCLSFIYGLWGFTWVVFLVAAAIQQVIKAVFVSKYSD